MITLANDKVKEKINVPTSIADITPEVLTKLSENIVLPKYYVLVALCWDVHFADVFFNAKKNKEAKVIPLCAKANVDEEYNWLTVGKKLILSRSGIEMGVHVSIPNAASMNSISRWAEAVAKAENPNAKGININTLPNGKFILVEFKVVGVNNINGCIESDVLTEDPFAVNE